MNTPDRLSKQIQGLNSQHQKIMDELHALERVQDARLDGLREKVREHGRAVNQLADDEQARHTFMKGLRENISKTEAALKGMQELLAQSVRTQEQTMDQKLAAEIQWHEAKRDIEIAGQPMAPHINALRKDLERVQRRLDLALARRATYSGTPGVMVEECSAEPLVAC